MCLRRRFRRRRKYPFLGYFPKLLGDRTPISPPPGGPLGGRAPPPPLMCFCAHVVFQTYETENTTGRTNKKQTNTKEKTAKKKFQKQFLVEKEGDAN